jgi:class 3 adenylate cyclase/DNA-binding CsgD family transcriptional regulator
MTQTSSGLVTLLFTDLVGSTELLARAGDEEAQRIFSSHHRLLSEAVARHGGDEVKWLGDGLMVAFSSAADAVSCAIGMQQTACHSDGGVQLAIRVGLTAGEALRDVTDYFGAAVVTAKRLCDRADAGQILCSELVTGLLAGRPGFTFTALGELELKGLPAPVPVYEVRYAADVAFADPLASLRNAMHRHDWQAALDIARTVPVDSPELDADRSDLMADAAWWLGRLDDCIVARERAYRSYDELGNHRRAGQCAVWLFEHHAMKASPAMAGAWLRRARRALADDPDCTEHGAMLLREAEVAHGSGELDRAHALAAAVIVLSRTLHSADLEAQALQTVGRILIDQGEVADGLGHLDEAMLFAVEGRLGPYATGKIYCSLISACEELGDFDRSAEWTEATTKWAQQHPFAIFPGICRIHRAVVLKRSGALAEAEHEAERACEELHDRHVGNCAAAYAEVGDIRRRLGQLDRAEEAFAEAQRLCGQPCGGLALLRLAQGRTETALAIITGCLSNTKNQLARSALLPSFVHVAIAAGDLPAAAEALTELDAIAAGFQTRTLRATALSSRARLQLAEGNADEACGTLRQALDAWQVLRVPYEVATTHTLLGQALRQRGDNSGAAESFAAASTLFDQIGVSLDARRLADEAHPALPAGLTMREVEVLRLIAAGMTNNEIAAALCLSVKTVSRHLSNIFTKIGVTSRAAATAFAFEHQLVEARP